MKKELLSKTGYSGALFLIIVVVYIFVPPLLSEIPHEYLELIKHLLLILSAMLGVHFLERAFLWKDIAERNKHSLEEILNPAIELLGSAKKCGLEMLYVDRSTVREDIMPTIRNAQKRVWLLGIAFSEEIRLGDVLDECDKLLAKNGQLDLRILLLDIFRSPAVFRSFLESSKSEVKEMLDFDRTVESRNLEPYRRVRMFQDFDKAYSFLKNSRFKQYVKYYGQNPNCWMVVVDDIVYFEPYTFGRGNVTANQKKCMGALMPVFKFEKKDKVNTFHVLEDHFLKMWLTSNLDMFHITSRIYDSDALIKKIFEERHAWLKHIYGSMYLREGTFDRRKLPRICETSIPIATKKGTEEVELTITNYSEKGLCLQTVNNAFKIGEIFRIDRIPQDLCGQYKFVLDKLRNYDFKVIWLNTMTNGQINFGALNANDSTNE